MSDSEAGRSLRSGAMTSSTQTNAAGDKAAGGNAAKRRKPFPGEEILYRMVAEARYEVDVDPYRGMTRYAGDFDEESAARSAKVTTLSPWESSCRWNSPADENDAADSSQGATLVQMVCQSRCPCLRNWTDQQLQKKKSKKRKKSATTEPRPTIGRRPDKDAERCRCDYNPFCLGTLGGVMDEVWQKRLESLNLSDKDSPTATAASLPNDSSAQSSEEAEVIDLQESGSDDGTPVNVDPTFSADPSLEEKKTLYSHRTWTRLRDLRQSALVEAKRIRSYLSATLQGLTSLVSLDTCMERIEAWHNELLFENPLLKAKSKDGHMRLAVPPGIENLGATCYLNTQLQCLAQITVFLNGIFSWRAPLENTGDKVNEVLTLFQQIMANLHSGPQRTITTVEFSNALGIDHYEQQDPNEFSRLFFDLMHNAFQKEASSKPGGLPELLPDLFQGMIKNQIVCKKCGYTSERKEAFMDLNLPIVKKSEEDVMTKKVGQLSILECLGNQVETDVQFLFDRYCRDEILQGDNQYHCEVCGCKQDACRHVRFEKVPPLLNIQLSRYTYDMKTFAKKKVSDKVLLPLEMQVSSEAEGSDVSTEHRYLLCAVMIHKGKSAYSGHYIAQAMDWTTGSWFEFNDTHVKLLKDGPDSSVDPKSETANSKKGPSGSQDAYNLFYVEEAFLAGSVLDRIKTMESTKSLPQVVDEKSAERISLFEDLRALCVKDSEASDRLKRRRDGILNDLFSPDRPLELLFDNMDPPPVWVPGPFIRRFLSCTDRFEDDLAQDIVSDVIKTSDCLCEHGQVGIHPRSARRGKLLPRVVYETIFSSLHEERESLLADQTKVSVERQDGFVVSPSESMFCQECVDQFCLNVRPKLELLEDLLFLFEELDSKNDDASIEYETGAVFECEKEKFIYIVARRFCTALKDHTKLIMKKVAAVDADSFPIEEKLLPVFESIAEGIEAIDMKDLEVTENSNVDKYVNSFVTCSHGCCTRFTKQTVRFVSWKVWSRIQKIFPDAIEHRVARRSVDEVEVVDLVEGCPQCESDGTMVYNLSKQIALTAKSFRGIKEVDCDQVLLSDDCNGTQTFHVIHRSEWKTLKKFGREFSKFNSKSDPEVIRQQVLGCLLKPEDASLHVVQQGNADSSALNEIDRRTVQLVSKLVSPLQCTTHRVPISGIVLDKSRVPNQHLSRDVCLLDSDSYSKYISSLSALARLLILSEEKFDLVNVLDDDGDLQDDDLKELCRKQETNVGHPKLVQKTRLSEGTVIVELATMSIPVSFVSELCCDRECLEEFEKAFPPSPKQNGTTKLSSGSTADDAILIDVSPQLLDQSPTSASKFSLAVFEAETTASVDKILEGLTQYTLISTGQEKEFSELFLRRSSRRRKTRIPSGVLISEETVQADMQSNVAALRLLLMESLREGTPFDPNHRVLLIVSPVDTRAEPGFFEQEKDAVAKVVELNFGLNESSLMELSENALGGDLSALVPKDSLIVVRQAIVDESALAIDKESLMDYLISLSNAGIPGSNGKKRKARVVERGFTGTLLSAGVANSKKARRDDEGNQEMDDAKQASSSGNNPVECRALAVVDKNSAPPASNDTDLSEELLSPKKNSDPPVLSDEVLVHDDHDDDDATEKEGGGILQEKDVTFADQTAEMYLMECVRDRLKTNPNVDSTNCSKAIFEASCWVCTRHPSEKNVERLAEVAYAKYLEITLN